VAGTPEGVVRRFIDEIFVAGRTEAVEELVTADFVSHGLPGSGPEVMRSAIERVSGALSEASFEIEDVISAGDRVAVRLTSSAVHSGTFMRMPATGRRYRIEEIHIFRVEDGRVAEHWHQMDALGMLAQLGLLPGGSG
jgi:predicted ester cyclase